MEIQIDARSQIREFIRRYKEDRDRTNAPVVADEVVEHFSDDIDFLRAFAQQTLRRTAHNIALEMLPSCPVIIYRDKNDELPVSSQVIADVSMGNGLGARFDDWWARAEGWHLRIRTMNRTQLVIAIRERRRGIRGDLVDIRFYEMVAQGLKNNAQRVEDRYSDDELTDLWLQAKQEVEEAENA